MVYDNPNTVPPSNGNKCFDNEGYIDRCGVAIEDQKDYGKSTGLTYISRGDRSSYELVPFGNYT